MIMVLHGFSLSNHQIIKLSNYIVFSNLFIAFCALAYAAKTSLLLYGDNGNIHVNLLVFFSILFMYCFHRINKKNQLTSGEQKEERFTWSYDHKKTVYVLLAISLTGDAFQLLFLPFRTWCVIIPVGALGLGYTFPVIPAKTGWKRLRDIYLLKTLCIAFAFSWLTTFLPVIFTESVSALVKPPALFIFVRSFLFIAALCIPFDIRDIKYDQQKGLKTLPVIAGIKTSILIAIGLLILFLLLVIMQHYYLGLGLRETSALLLSGLITIAIMPFATPGRPKLFFHLMYDGGMLLQWALLTGIMHI
jgi:4-hydroxybenzoate polyprenyltransferase